MNDFHIRNTKEDDFLDIAEIAGNCSPMITERNSIYHIFTKFFQNTSLVAVAGNTMVGFILGFISQENPQEAYLHLLCVIPEWRKRGIAKTLVKEFMSIVAKKDCLKVYLITKPQNKTAIKFYENLGFRADGDGEKIQINGIEAVKDYNGPQDHKVIFYRSISGD